jgi:hypothetical protein
VPDDEELPPLVDDPPASEVLADPPLDESPVEDSFADSDFAALSPPPSEPLPAVDASRAALRDAVPRSFFAQPLPRK